MTQKNPSDTSSESDYSKEGNDKTSELRTNKSSDLQPNKTMSRAFWITIFAMAFASIALILIGSQRSPYPEKTSSALETSESSPAPLEVPTTTLERLFSEAAKQSYVEAAPRIDEILTDIYAPVYAAIPIYAAFHYSVFGEYTELGQAALGEMNKALNEKLFDGFGERFEREAALLDQEYANNYFNALQSGLRKEFPSFSFNAPLGPITEAAISDAFGRAKVAVPLATVAAATAGRGALKASTAAISKKIAARVAAKAAAKGVAKGGGILVGAGGGALLCSWSGPGAAACGVVGAVAAWLVTDAVIINLDEYFNRDEFEAELRQIIGEDRAEKKLLLEAALKEKAIIMDAAAKDFTMRELSE